MFTFTIDFKKFKLRLFICTLSIFFIQLQCVTAQLCNGSLGDPLVNITFGNGTNPGPPLLAATTAYNFVSADCPSDGSYTVRTNTSNCFGSTWHNISTDHTGDLNGYFMLVNSSYQPSDFYVDTIKNLCGGTTYEFAAWIINLIKPTSCGGNTIKPNITFSIEKIDGTIIQNYNTGNIQDDNSPTWKQYGFFFTTPTTTPNVVVRMRNNGQGGCGNDVGLDDITFKPCGPKLIPSIVGSNTVDTSLCEGNAVNLNFSCSVSAGFNNPVFQWQKAFNGSTFVDIVGENNSNLSVNFLSNAGLGVYQYRLSVAESGNLNTAQCRISCLPIKVSILKNPTATITTNAAYCQGTRLILTASGGSTYSWIGANNFTVDTNIVVINNIQPINNGHYTVTITDVYGCKNIADTNIAINLKPTITTSFVETTICDDRSVQLNAISTASISWKPIDFLSTNNIANPVSKPVSSIKYMAIAKDVYGCTDTAYSSIIVIKKPIVDAGENRIIVANRNATFLGSINGDYQSFEWLPAEYITNATTLTPTVNPPIDKKYILSVTAKNNCGVFVDSVFVKIYQGIFIPNSFTPNADNKNDTWNIPSLEAYPLHELSVFNRYGEKVFERKQSFNSWDGKYNGMSLPNGTYIYLIDLKNGSPVIKGTVNILR